jgi:hypothetical protein
MIRTFPSTTPLYTPISLLIDIYKPSLMSSDLIFPSSSPTAADALKIPFPKRYQSFEAKETDDESSPNRRVKSSPESKSGTSQASLAATDINSRPAELPPALWAPTGTGSNNTLGVIRIQAIPPQPFHTPVKRKCRDKSPDPCFSTLSVSPSPKLPAKKWRPNAFDQEASSELEVFVQRSKGKLRRRLRSPKISDTSSKHRRPGRPHKVSTDPQNCDFSAHVYVEIANLPKLHRGKTHKTDKYVPQGPTTEGPFTLTHYMGWESFLSHVAELAGLEEENPALTQMTWHFQGKTKSLPLGNIGGFMAMVTQIRALRVGASAMIMLGLPVPPAKPSRGGHNAPAVTNDVHVTDSGAGEVRWDEKVNDSCILRTMARTYVYVCAKA